MSVAGAEECAEAQLRREVDRLTAELQASRDRLETWKEKAKIGVEELRARVVDLTRALRESVAERERLQRQLSSPSSPSPVHTENASSASWPPFLDAALSLCLSTTVAKADELSTALALAHHAELHATQEELDAHKRRTDVTLRLHTKNYETLQKETEELRRAVQLSRDEIQTRDRALLGRDEAIAKLEQQLETALAVRRQLEEERGRVMGVPDMQELNHLDELVEDRVREVRAELALVEGALHAQHKDALSRLAAEHAEEVAALQRDAEERVATAVEETRAAMLRAASRSSATLHGGDDAYATLLRDYAALREQLDAAQHECVALRTQQPAHAALTRTPTSGVTASQADNSTAGQSPTRAHHPPRTLPEALRAMAEMEANLQFVSDELCRAKREVVSLRHGRDPGTTTAAAPGAMEAQQVAYLRGVVVNVLCAHRDDRVLLRLLPVLQTLLHLESAELDRIYKANPQWKPCR